MVVHHPQLLLRAHVQKGRRVLFHRPVSCLVSDPLSSGYGTYKTVKARFWLWLRIIFSKSFQIPCPRNAAPLPRTSPRRARGGRHHPDVQGSGFNAKSTSLGNLGFRVQGPGSSGQGSGSRVHSAGCRIIRV